jgi:hypothetical protein
MHTCLYLGSSRANVKYHALDGEAGWTARLDPLTVAG